MQQENRPPYVEFETKAVEDRAATIASGVYQTKDVDFIIIVPAGSEGKSRIVQEYADWLAKIKPRTGAISGPDGHYLQQSRFPPDWVEKIERMHSLWKKGEMMEVEGTPMKNWPVVSPAQLKVCLDMHLMSVEMLADAADDTVTSLGMGGIALRQRARDWLKQSIGDVPKLLSQLESAKIDAASKEVRMKSLEEQLAAVQSQLLSLTTQKRAA
jgi:hypothetical protein